MFAGELPEGHDPRWEKVTVEQVVKHRFGTGEGYLDIDVEDIRDYGTNDFLQVVFRHPLAFEPGTHDQYSDAAYYLLSRVVSKNPACGWTIYSCEAVYTSAISRSRMEQSAPWAIQWGDRIVYSRAGYGQAGLGLSEWRLL
ncbi:MAG: serine hydrolase [Clostridia bacterium]